MDNQPNLLEDLYGVLVVAEFVVNPAEVTQNFVQQIKLKQMSLTKAYRIKKSSRFYINIQVDPWFCRTNFVF